jgi:chromosome segregation ATPase
MGGQSMFKKLMQKLEQIQDNLIGISMTLNNQTYELDCILERMGKLEKSMGELEKSIAMLQEVRNGGEIEQGLGNIMNFSGRVKKNG